MAHSEGQWQDRSINNATECLHYQLLPEEWHRLLRETKNINAMEKKDQMAILNTIAHALKLSERSKRLIFENLIEIYDELNYQSYRTIKSSVFRTPKKPYCSKSSDIPRSIVSAVEELFCCREEKRSALLKGPSKLFAIQSFCRMIDRADDLLLLDATDNLEFRSLLGNYVSDDLSGKFKFRPGLLIDAMTKGKILVLRNIDQARFDFQANISSIAEKRLTFCPNSKMPIVASPEFFLIATVSSGHNSHQALINEHNWHKISMPSLNIQNILADLETTFPSIKQRREMILSILNSVENLISTRPIVKLISRIHRCSTSQESRMITETELDNLFLDIVDVFGSTLSEEAISNAIGISIPRSRYLKSTAYKPTLKLTETRWIVGRVSLPFDIKPGSSLFHSFALNGHATRLLEKLAVAVQNNENPLLVGETGIGKTTIIQFLAQALGYTLISINLSNQTEVTDLLGSYKIINYKQKTNLLMKEWNLLFSKTFSSSKNETFLHALNKAHFDQNSCLLLKIMAQGCKAAIKSLNKNSQEEELPAQQSSQLKKKRRTSSSLLSSWKRIEREIDTLKKGRSAFTLAFTEGIIIKAMKKGSWILLDEINLAQPALLEALSQILSTRSIILPESLEVERKVEAHLQFRVFAAMNPATDFGKRPLAPSIKSYFSEILVESPDSDKSDLTSIALSCFGQLKGRFNSYIPRMIEFYYEAKRLADSAYLIDGSNTKPVYSVRSLTRSIKFCLKLSEEFSIHRCVFEGLILGFLVFLKRECVDLLQNKLQQLCFPDSDCTFSISSKADTAAQVLHRYKIKFNQDILNSSQYIFTPSVIQNFVNLVRAVKFHNNAILLQGPTSSGKTSMIELLATLMNKQIVRINNHEHTDLEEYLGSFISSSDGQIVFQEGLLLQAVRNGAWIILDELNLAPSDILEALNRLLDDNRELFVPELEEIVKAHPDFLLFATQNPAGVYGGRKQLSRAFRSRFIEINFDEIPEPELETILHTRCQIAPSFAKKMISIYQSLELERQTTRIFDSKNSFVTLRDLFRWGLRKIESVDDLAKHGFMLIAEKARSNEDREIVRHVIEQVTNIRIYDHDLYYSSLDNSFKENQRLTESSITWTKAFLKSFTLIKECLANKEPILLIGDTGSGKTTLCQFLAQVLSQELVILNAHSNLETSDLVGAQRPNRSRHLLQLERDEILKTSGDTSEIDKKLSVLFEWVDGPLVKSMLEGHVFLFDEINLADDAVLERLNPLLEPSRTMVIPDRPENKIIKSHETFMLIATMNPGGDYGKRELSPALRNRFTEIWVPSSIDRYDLEIITRSFLPSTENTIQLASAMVDFAIFHSNLAQNLQIQSISALSHISIRDLKHWAEYISVRRQRSERDISINIWSIFFDGCSTTYLDGLDTSKEQCHIIDRNCREYLESKLQGIDTESRSSALSDLNVLSNIDRDSTNYFTASKSTMRSARKIVRALELTKPILLEGPPGAGKSTLVANLANAFNKKFIRINLSQDTEIIDLLGTDVPKGNRFEWADAEFLSALKYGWWVLLDEMNLAPQSILEGLNSILDHRGQVFIPELGKTFIKHENFRVFAAQNPHSQGKGRKGLPRSFINRFSTVFVHEQTPDDLFSISKMLYPSVASDDDMTSAVHALSDLQNVTWSLGNPWEFNLRDLQRFFQAIQIADYWSSFETVFCDRMRSFEDFCMAQNVFIANFKKPVIKHKYKLEISSEAIEFGHLRLPILRQVKETPKSYAEIVFPLEKQPFKSIMTGIHHHWPTIITAGPQNMRKALSSIRFLANTLNAPLVEFCLSPETDTNDVLGSFEQYDILNKMEESLEKVKSELYQRLHREFDLNLADLLHSLLTLDLQNSEQLNACVRNIISHFPELSDELLQEHTEKSSFIWKPSKFIDAVREGQWVVFEHANAASDAVLERINCLLEPGGSLQLNEIADSNGVIKPHPNFRIFFLADPKNGELSRPLRNRCHQISFDDALYISQESLSISNIDLLGSHTSMMQLTLKSKFIEDALSRFCDVFENDFQLWAKLVFSVLNLNEINEDTIILHSEGFLKLEKSATRVSNPNLFSLILALDQNFSDPSFKIINGCKQYLNDPHIEFFLSCLDFCWLSLSSMPVSKNLKIDDYAQIVLFDAARTIENPSMFSQHLLHNEDSAQTMLSIEYLRYAQFQKNSLQLDWITNGQDDFIGSIVNLYHYAWDTNNPRILDQDSAFSIVTKLEKEVTFLGQYISSFLSESNTKLMSDIQKDLFHQMSAMYSQMTKISRLKNLGERLRSMALLLISFSCPTLNVNSNAYWRLKRQMENVKNTKMTHQMQIAAFGELHPLSIFFENNFKVDETYDNDSSSSDQMIEYEEDNVDDTIQYLIMSRKLLLEHAKHMNEALGPSTLNLIESVENGFWKLKKSASVLAFREPLNLLKVAIRLTMIEKDCPTSSEEMYSNEMIESTPWRLLSTKASQWPICKNSPDTVYQIKTVCYRSISKNRTINSDSIKKLKDLLLRAKQMILKLNDESNKVMIEQNIMFILKHKDNEEDFDEYDNDDRIPNLSVLSDIFWWFDQLFQPGTIHPTDQLLLDCFNEFSISRLPKVTIPWHTDFEISWFNALAVKRIAKSRDQNPVSDKLSKLQGDAIEFNLFDDVKSLMQSLQNVHDDDAFNLNFDPEDWLGLQATTSQLLDDKSTGPAQIIKNLEAFLPKLSDIMRYYPLIADSIKEPVQHLLTSLIKFWRLQLRGWEVYIETQEEFIRQTPCLFFLDLFEAICGEKSKWSVALVCDFILESTYGQFEQRLRILKSISSYLNIANKAKSQNTSSLLLNCIVEYYYIFSSQVTLRKASLFRELKKEMVDATLIFDWNYHNEIAALEVVQRAKSKISKGCKKARDILNSPIREILLNEQPWTPDIKQLIERESAQTQCSSQIQEISDFVDDTARECLSLPESKNVRARMLLVTIQHLKQNFGFTISNRVLPILHFSHASQNKFVKLSNQVSQNIPEFSDVLHLVDILRTAILNHHPDLTKMHVSACISILDNALQIIFRLVDLLSDYPVKEENKPEEIALSNHNVLQNSLIFFLSNLDETIQSFLPKSEIKSLLEAFSAGTAFESPANGYLKFLAREFALSPKDSDGIDDDQSKNRFLSNANEFLEVLKTSKSSIAIHFTLLLQSLIEEKIEFLTFLQDVRLFTSATVKLCQLFMFICQHGFCLGDEDENQEIEQDAKDSNAENQGLGSTKDTETGQDQSNEMQGDDFNIDDMLQEELDNLNKEIEQEENAVQMDDKDLNDVINDDGEQNELKDEESQDENEQLADDIEDIQNQVGEDRDEVHAAGEEAMDENLKDEEQLEFDHIDESASGDEDGIGAPVDENDDSVKVDSDSGDADEAMSDTDEAADIEEIEQEIEDVELEDTSEMPFDENDKENNDQDLDVDVELSDEGAISDQEDEKILETKKDEEKDATLGGLDIGAHNEESTSEINPEALDDDKLADDDEKLDSNENNGSKKSGNDSDLHNGPAQPDVTKANESLRNQDVEIVHEKEDEENVPENSTDFDQAIIDDTADEELEVNKGELNELQTLEDESQMHRKAKQEPIEEDDLRDDTHNKIQDPHESGIQEENLESFIGKSSISKLDEEYNDDLSNTVDNKQLKTAPQGSCTAEIRDLWLAAERSSSQASHILAEELRLLFEPTVASKYVGDFKTGKRLNLKKIIGYIASEYRRDKIWLRRTKPDRKNYQIMVAIDNSKSMQIPELVDLTRYSIVLLCKTFAILDIGQITALKFDEKVETLHDFFTPLNDEARLKIFQNLSFDKNSTDVCELLERAIESLVNAKSGFTQHSNWQLLIIISDGVHQDHKRVQRLLVQAKSLKILVVFVLIDPSATIMNMTQVNYHTDEQTGETKLQVQSYMQNFPFEYYVVIRDMKSLPSMLSMALRQWFTEVAESS